MSAKEIVRGLMIRIFDGQIDQTPDEKDKTKKRILKYKYPRVCFPWSRTGKDHEDKDVSGSVPSLSETLAALNASGFSTEFELNSEGEPIKPSVVGLLIDGWNRHEQLIARAKAENTPEQAKAAALATFAKKMGISVEDAEKMFSAMFSTPAA